MCDCFTIDQLKREKRQLWRSIAAAYATDGSNASNMVTWANVAVSDYEKTFKPDVVKCTCGGINNNQSMG
jgi:hypothetical protein